MSEQIEAIEARIEQLKNSGRLSTHEHINLEKRRRELIDANKEAGATQPDDTFNSDVRYIRMTPQERLDHLISVYGCSLDAAQEVVSDAFVEKWFAGKGEGGRARLGVAQAIKAPISLDFSDLAHWHQRAIDLLGKPIAITAPTEA